jgi:hypothetical protein
MAELGNFVDDGTNHYKASFGHDDIVMSAIQSEFVRATLQYKILRDEFTAGMQPTNENVYNPFEGYTNAAFSQTDFNEIFGEQDNHVSRLGGGYRIN